MFKIQERFHVLVWLVFKMDRNKQVFVLLLPSLLHPFVDYLQRKSLRIGCIVRRAFEKVLI